MGMRLAVAVVLATIACAPRPSPSEIATAPGCRTTLGAPALAPGDTVRWRIAGDSADARRLDAWCREVGPAVVVQPPARPHPLPDSVPIFSWNLHVGAADLGAFVRDIRAGALTGGRPPGDFVILTQEAHRGRDRRRRRRDVIDASRAAGLGVYYAPSMRSDRGEPGADDRGNAILSTLPLSDLEAVELPLERQRRVAILATVRLGADSAPLRLVDVHLENLSGSLLPDDRSTGTGRRYQMGELLRIVQLPGATVLAGDFNTWALGPEEAVVADLVEIHGFTAALPGSEPTLVSLFGLFRRRLDHVLFRLPEGWHGTAQRIATRYGSDHHPLMAWVGRQGVKVP